MKKIVEELAASHQKSWKIYTQSLSREFEKVLLSDSDFRFALEKVISHARSPLSALFIRIHSKTPGFRSNDFGRKQSTKPTLTETIDLDTHGWFQCTISLWRNHTPSDYSTDEIKRFITGVIKAFWKQELRDDKTHLISQAIASTKGVINNTINIYNERKTYITYYFADLDNFGSVNDTYGQASGDSLILQIASKFDAFVRQFNIVAIHRSGDEFIFILFSKYAEDALKFAYEFQKHLSNLAVEIPKADGKKTSLKVSLTLGMNICSKYLKENSDYALRIKHAEESMKSDGKKLYGYANLYNSSSSKSRDRKLDKFTIQSSLILAKTSRDIFPFENIWLNFIVQEVYESQKNGTSNVEIDRLLRWISIKDINICKSSNGHSKTPDFSKRISHFDILIAVARGMLVYDCAKGIKKKYAISKRGGQLRLLYGTNNVLVTLKSNKFGKNIVLGASLSKVITPVSVLIKIGHEPLEIPKQIFVETIVVDNRPSKGGGLPDFWEATIARMVNTISKNSNVKKVYVVGEQKHGKNTIEILNNIAKDKVNKEILSTKINTTIQPVEQTIKRLKRNLHIFDDLESLIDSYSRFITRGSNITTSHIESTNDFQPTFLNKELQIANYSLLKEDGFRIETLSEAYPLMLEVARKASLNHQIRDQAGVELGELIDFKVELLDPLKNPIPLYYRQESEKFEDYYNTHFISKKGLFASHLNRQVNRVIEHVVSAISNDEHPFATRRAILIIPNESKANGELAPLGLVSIRIIPRFNGPKKVQLNYSYSWRTVEALVGFPYSFYGSIRYSDYLTDRIKSQLADGKFDVSLGNLSYIAHSLHIFKDDFGQRIAKRISDNASI